MMSTDSDLHALRLAAFEAGRVYHAAGSSYFGAISNRSSKQEISQALEQCIITGEQYRTALQMFLDELQNGAAHDEEEDAQGRVERLLELLDLELQKFSDARAAEILAEPKS